MNTNLSWGFTPSVNFPVALVFAINRQKANFTVSMKNIFCNILRTSKTTGKSTAGFTLIEIVVVMGIFSLIFCLGTFASFSSYNRYVFNSEKETLVTLLYSARSRALNNISGFSHGVHIDKEGYTIFKGETYDEDDPGNLLVERNNVIHIEGISEVVFAALSGNPNVVGEIVVTKGEQTGSIFIENEGKITW